MAGQARTSHVGGRTIAGAVASITTCMVLMVGCTSLASAPTVAEQLDQEFSAADGVISVEMTGTQPLPLEEDVHGSVTMSPESSAAQVDEIAERLAGFAASHPRITSWNVTLQAGEITVGLDPDAQTVASRLSIARDLADSRGVVAAHVEADFREPDLLVQVDDPAALVSAYAAAADLAVTLPHDDSPIEISAVSDDITSPDYERDPENAFEISNRPVPAEGGQLDAGMRLYDLVRAKLTLRAATVTAEKLILRVADERDIIALERLVAENSRGLRLDLQGGRTTRKPDAGPHATAVAIALRDVEEATRIQLSEEYLNVEVASPADARTVLDDARRVPEFTGLEGFSLTIPSTFTVSDKPTGIAEALGMAESAAALPFVTSVEVLRNVPNQAPSVDLRLSGTSEHDIAAFSTRMKPLLVSGGWQVRIDADGHVESFTAADRITLDDPVTDRDAADRDFAEALKRVWDDTAG